MASSKALMNDFSGRKCNLNFLNSKILELPPSCLEFVPRNSENDTGEYFIVGTYYLQNTGQPRSSPQQGSNGQDRKGSLILFKLSGSELILVETVPYPSAILDLHFYKDQNFFAIASSTGTISIYQLIEKKENFFIQHIATYQVASKDVLVLSLTWYPTTNTCNTQQSPVIFFTLSNGEVLGGYLSADFKTFTMLNDGRPLIVHGDNAWTSTITCNTLFSGGDDSKLSRLDFDLLWQDVEGITIVTKRSNIDPLDANTAQIDYREHQAGVTAILILPTPSIDKNEKIILTGSYDDHVRVFMISDKPAPRRSIILKLTELRIGGGVWRLKLMETHLFQSGSDKTELEYVVLASCMHAGARILKVAGSYHGSWSIQELAEIRTKSMCYSSDVQPPHSALRSLKDSKDYSTYENFSKARIIVSSSFYDKLILVWTWE